MCSITFYLNLYLVDKCVKFVEAEGSFDNQKEISSPVIAKIVEYTGR